MSIRTLLLTASVIAVTTPTAFAQSSDQDDEVVVTGSRIPQDPNIISAVPVQSIDREDFLLSGELNIADVVNDIPALVASTTSENTVTGANQLNLRGLGAERSLTLVNGRRHVAGFRGTSSVDIGSIPQALVESVEVSTGGASAVYGADAVTGVVNFILKDDFEGLDLNLRGGMSTEGDAENFSASALYGKNFDNDRGNITFAASVTADSVLTRGDRNFARIENFLVAQDNPARLFQVGDITDATPNLASFYGYNGFSPIVLGSIPTSADFIAAYTARFGSAPNLNATEQAILDRANAPLQALVPDFTFWLSSQQGSIIPGDFGNFGDPNFYFVDVNGNGLNDCLETGTGQQLGSFLAGCWVVDDNGQVRLFNDGLFANGAEGSGGDGARQSFNSDYLIPQTTKYDFNLNANYDLADNLTLFFEGKYVLSSTDNFDDYDEYYDTLLVAPDNPFIPAELQAVANASGGLRVTQDARGWSNSVDNYERETMRFVGGLRWVTDSGINFEFSGNHGRFKRTDETAFSSRDRYFAAIDVTTDANGNPICRSELDPTAVPFNDEFFSSFSITNPYVPGFYTFTPGQGLCQPLNIFGENNVSDEARAFITELVEDEIEITQTVISGIVSGEIDKFQNFLDGSIGFAGGVEYRRETSESRLNDFELGIVPQGSPLPAGVQISSLVPGMNSFNFDNTAPSNTRGSYDVREVFGELRLPVFLDQPFAKELTVDGAIRYADYSTSGGNTTWKVGGTWAPISDLSFRGTYSKAVRAPNVSELFDPRLPITVNASEEPCSVANVAGSINPSARQAACVADLQAIGVADSAIFDTNGNYAWRNPLTARFSGVSGGNPNLSPEVAKTFTLGTIIRPSFIDRLSITLDYWDIEIDDAVGVISAADIFSGCYDRGVQSFCNLFSRVTNSAAPTFGGLTFIDSSSLNFARVEADGLDFAVNYSFDWSDYTFGASLVGSRQFNLDRFFNPLDPTDVDPELNEIQRPELTGNLVLSVEKGPVYVGFQTNYQSKQSYGEVETRETNWGPDGGWTDDSYIFDANASYEFNDTFTFFGGVNNITNETPFATQLAWPASPRGRYVFLGLNAQF